MLVVNSVKESKLINDSLGFHSLLKGVAFPGKRQESLMTNLPIITAIGQVTIWINRYFDHVKNMYPS